MRDPAARRRAVLGWSAGAAVLASMGLAAPAETQRLLDLQRGAGQLLERAAAAAAAGDGGEFSRLAKEAAQRIDSLGAAGAVAPELRKELKDAAIGLRARAQAPPAGFSPDEPLRLLARVAARL